MSKMKKLFSSAGSKSSKGPAVGPEQYVRSAAEGLTTLAMSKDPKLQAKAVDDLAKFLRDIKEILYGNTEKFPTPELGVQVTAEIFRGEFFSQLVRAVPLLEFDARRDASQIVANLQRQKVNNRMVASDYLESHTDLLDLMIRGYENTDNALFYGSMLRDCIRHQAVAKYILDCADFLRFFQYMELPSFEIASDAAASFKELLTRHKSTVAEFLQRKYEFFFGEYQKLLESPNYITRRMAIKMLNEFLLERPNAATLQRYVGSKENLRVIMMLLKEPNKSIQVEALYMFTAFVSNESRPSDISMILLSNKEKLLRFLNDCTMEKEDQRFEKTKATLVQLISELKEP